MTIQSFKNLNKKQKRIALLRKGQFLADRKTDLFSVFLFRIGDFFVELFFSRENEQVVGIRPLQQLRRLKQYQSMQAVPIQ